MSHRQTGAQDEGGAWNARAALYGGLLGGAGGVAVIARLRGLLVRGRASSHFAGTPCSTVPRGPRPVDAPREAALAQDGQRHGPPAPGAEAARDVPRAVAADERPERGRRHSLW